jgi:hypothetical protein
MTFYYRTTSYDSKSEPSESTKAYWQTAAKKSNWRISELPNGYYQAEVKFEEEWHDITRRSTIEEAEEAIDASVAHFTKRLGFLEGPKVVKTFE